jgi:hypothetical protein
MYGSVFTNMPFNRYKLSLSTTIPVGSPPFSMGHMDPEESEKSVSINLKDDGIPRLNRRSRGWRITPVVIQRAAQD